jgi:translation initiation factor IF-3
LAFLNVILIIIKEFRINQSIKSPTIRLIDAEGEQKGIMGTDKARQMAKEQSLDLVEVSPQAHPPVCRIMDYGKHLYKQKKIDQNQKKSQKQTEVKTVRITIRTDSHDLQTKAKMAERFLKDKHLVKISLIFKGREITHFELGEQKLQQFIEILSEVSTVDTPPKRQGNNLMAIIGPKK